MTAKAPSKKVAPPAKKAAAKPAAKAAAKPAAAPKAPAKTAAKTAAKPAAAKAAPAVDKIGLKELAASVSESLPAVSPATVRRVVEEVFGQMSAAVGQGVVVNIKDFGKLALVHRDARVGRNPATGEPVQIAAKSALKFTFAKALKDAVA